MWNYTNTDENELPFQVDYMDHNIYIFHNHHVFDNHMDISLFCPYNQLVYIFYQYYHVQKTHLNHHLNNEFIVHRH